MLTKEQIAHDLTMVYLNNYYGIDVSGELSISTYDDDTSGSGTISTTHLPGVGEKKNTKQGIWKRGFLGREKKTQIDDSYIIDDFVDELVGNYIKIYTKILRKLNSTTTG